MSITKNFAAIILAPIAIASVAVISVNAKDDTTPKLNEKEQAVLDKALEGRTAGRPQNCITRTQQKKLKFVNDDILIFGSRNTKTIFVNKPYGGCPGAKRNTLTYSRPSTSLCSGDIAQVVDLLSRASFGSCAFGEFIPYTKDEE